MRKEGKDYTVIDGDIIHFKCKIVKWKKYDKNIVNFMNNNLLI